MQKDITVSINPLYGCNFRCQFCYLKTEELSSKKQLNLKQLEIKLKEVTKYRNISHVDLYGGEISLLDNNYLLDLNNVLNNYYTGHLNIVTNLSKIIPFFENDKIILSVSWDYNCRQDYEKVLNNILSLNRPVHILMLASPKMINWSDVELRKVIEILNIIENVKSVEIKPYSSNQANQFQTTYKDFEDFIKKWLRLKKSFKFKFINEKLIIESITKKNSSWSDDHIYINPDGNFCVLDFDEFYHEKFLVVKSFKDYIDWYNLEKEKIFKNINCANCSYLGSCLSEHLKNLTDHSQSCDGFKGLLEWYRYNSYEGVIN